MKAVGIIVEYNPFHNGHAYHLKKAKEEANADIVIAVMSGQFLQRGEPALLPKWTRTRMALMGGVDIVLELPYQFATQKADTFAKGAVSILASIGCDSLCFGSESGDIGHFKSTLDFIQKNNKQYQEKIKYYINQGVSYPKALSSAFKDFKTLESFVDLSKPNNILGFQYLKAAKDSQIPIEILTIARTSADYHDQHFSSNSVASATSIRKALFSEGGEIERVAPYVPETTLELLKNYYSEYRQLQQWENYWPYLKFRLLQTTPEELKKIYEVEEGLENRIIPLALEAQSFHDLMNRLKTKRYTWTRLQRMCVHILTNTKNEEMEERMKNVSYLRLLGMSEQGRKFLNKRKGEISLPLISKVSSFQKKDIDLDIRASRIYALGAAKHMSQNLLQMEYSQPPIYLKSANEKGTNPL